MYVCVYKYMCVYACVRVYVNIYVYSHRFPSASLPLVSVLSLLITWCICPTWEVKPQTLYDFTLRHREAETQSETHEKTNAIGILADLYDIIHRTVMAQDNALAVLSEYKMERIKVAIRYIEDHLHQPITLEDLSRACSTSPNYFCSLFKEVTGKTPGEYITALRMETASKLLLAGNSVADTAFACGFRDVSYFISVFRKRVGVSPKQYIKGFEKSL